MRRNEPTDQLQPDLPTTGPPSESARTVTLMLSGNPWTDLGIVALCESLSQTEQPFLRDPPVWAEHHVCFSVDPNYVEEMQAWLLAMFRECWNQLYWPSRAAKLFGRALVYQEDGFIDPNPSIDLLPEQQQQMKEELRLSSVEATESLVQMRLNYIAMPKDARKLQTDLPAVLRDLVAHWLEPTLSGGGRKKPQTCDVCGQPHQAARQITQGLNPLLNKHHNVQVRGFSGGNSYFRVCPVCFVANLRATLEVNVPFAYDTSAQVRVLILPDVQDLTLLRQVYIKLSRNLRNIADPERFRTSTNLRGQWAVDRYSLIIALFHNIFYRFSIVPETGEEVWNFDPEFDEQKALPKLTRWLILPFTKARNARFGNVHAVEVATRLYEFVRPIPFGGDDEVRLVPDILSRLSGKHPGVVSLIGRLSRAIATGNPSLLCQVMFAFWKHADSVIFSPQAGRPHPARLFPHFIRYFLEVNAVLNDELREDLRILGSMIGSVFSRDVTLVSKLYNVSSESALRATLNQVLFRLYKVGLGGRVDSEGLLHVNVHGEDKTATRIKRERFTRVLDQLSGENWREIAETLSTFTSLVAFNSNWPQSNQANPEEGSTDDE